MCCGLTGKLLQGKVIDQIPVLRLFEEDVVCAFFEAARCLTQLHEVRSL